MATATMVLTRVKVQRRFGLALRITVVIALLALASLPLLLGGDVWAQRISRGAIYAIIGLSINTLTGHAGQISLGHQAFVGIGAFSAAFMASRLGAPLGFGLAAAAVAGALTAAVIGLVALRVTGLYLALVTLAFGLTAETTIFNWREFTGGGAGAFAPRPEALAPDHAFALLCLGVLGLVLYLDWRLVSTKAGRALAAVRNNEQIASTLGVNVTGYKLAAFSLSGLVAGLAGGLFAHWNQIVQAMDFEFQVALVWVLMTVVGGLRSRLGVILASAFFALLPLTLPNFLAGLPWQPPFLNEAVYHVLPPFIVVVMLLIVLRFFPGGFGQLLRPATNWLTGKKKTS